MDIIQLSNQPKFDAKKNDIITLFPTCAIEKYGQNEIIFSSLNFSRYIFYIQNGKVKVTDISSKGRSVISGYYKKGDFVNLEVIKHSNIKKMSGISKSKNSIVVKISKEKFLSKLSRNSALQQYVFSQLLTEKTETERRIHRILDIKSSERVFDFIYHHTLKFGQRIGYEYVIREPLTHQEIAAYIGTARQTVTTSMNILRSKGILHFNRNYWIIRDLGSLRKIVSF